MAEGGSPRDIPFGEAYAKIMERLEELAQQNIRLASALQSIGVKVIGVEKRLTRVERGGPPSV